MPKPSLQIDEHDEAVEVDADSASPATPRAQLTPDDWVRAATDLLVTKSIDAVRVDVLAKQLDVTRGSFYWHFADVPAFHEGLAEQTTGSQVMLVVPPTYDLGATQSEALAGQTLVFVVDILAVAAGGSS